MKKTHLLLIPALVLFNNLLFSQDFNKTSKNRVLSIPNYESETLSRPPKTIISIVAISSSNIQIINGLPISRKSVVDHIINRFISNKFIELPQWISYLSNNI